MRNPNAGGRFVAPDGFMSSRDVCAIAGCTYRQLDYWCSRGVFGHNRSSGSGAYRAWPVSILEPVMAVADVVRAFHDLAGAFKGMSCDRLRQVAEEVERTSLHMGEVLVVTTTSANRAMDDGWRPEGAHMVVPLRQLEESHARNSRVPGGTIGPENECCPAACDDRAAFPNPSEGSEMAESTCSPRRVSNR